MDLVNPESVNWTWRSCNWCGAVRWWCHYVCRGSLCWFHLTCTAVRAAARWKDSMESFRQLSENNSPVVFSNGRFRRIGICSCCLWWVIKNGTQVCIPVLVLNIICLGKQRPWWLSIMNPVTTSWLCSLFLWNLVHTCLINATSFSNKSQLR